MHHTYEQMSSDNKQLLQAAFPLPKYYSQIKPSVDHLLVSLEPVVDSQYVRLTICYQKNNKSKVLYECLLQKHQAVAEIGIPDYEYLKLSFSKNCTLNIVNYTGDKPLAIKSALSVNVQNIATKRPVFIESQKAILFKQSFSTPGIFSIKAGKILLDKNVIVKSLLCLQAEAQYINAINGCLSSGLNLKITAHEKIDYEAHSFIACEFVHLVVPRATDIKLSNNIKGNLIYEFSSANPGDIVLLENIKFNGKLYLIAPNSIVQIGDQNAYTDLSFNNDVFVSAKQLLAINCTIYSSAKMALLAVDGKIGFIDQSSAATIPFGSHFPKTSTKVFSAGPMFLHFDNLLTIDGGDIITLDDMYMSTPKCDNISGKVLVAKNGYIACEHLLNRLLFKELGAGDKRDTSCRTQLPPDDWLWDAGPYAFLWRESGTQILSGVADFSILGKSNYCLDIKLECIGCSVFGMEYINDKPNNTGSSVSQHRTYRTLVNTADRCGHTFVARQQDNGIITIQDQQMYRAQLISGTDLNIGDAEKSAVAKEHVTTISGNIIAAQKIHINVAQAIIGVNDYKINLFDSKLVSPVPLFDAPLCSLFRGTNHFALPPMHIPDIELVVIDLDGNLRLGVPDGFEYDVGLAIAEKVYLASCINRELGIFKFGESLTVEQILLYLKHAAVEWIKANPQLNNAAFNIDEIAKLPYPTIVYRCFTEKYNKGMVEKTLRPELLIPPVARDPRIRAGLGGVFCNELVSHVQSCVLHGYIFAKEAISGEIERLSLIVQQYNPRQLNDIDMESANANGAAIIAGKVNLKIKILKSSGGSIIATDGEMTLECGRVDIESIAHRLGFGDNFVDYIIPAIFKASTILRITAGEDISICGAEFSSGTLTELATLGRIIDVPLELVKQSVQTYYGKRSHTTITETEVSHQASQFKSGADVKLSALGEILLIATRFKAKTAKVISATDFVAGTVQSIKARTEDTSKKVRTVFGSKKSSSNSTYMSSTAHGVEFDTEKFEIIAPKIVIKSIKSGAAVGNLIASGGQVSFLLGQNNFKSVEQHMSKSPIWQKFSSRVITHLQHCDSAFSGVINIDASKIDIEQVRGATCAYIEQLENKCNAEITYHTVDDYFNIESHEVSAPGPGLIALITVAVAIATDGAGASIVSKLGIAANQMVGAMASAGFSSLCAQAAVQLAANNGDPFKAMDFLADTDTFKSLATAMLTAGVMDKLLETLKIPPPKNINLFNDQVKYNLARAGVNASVNMSLRGQSMDEAVIGAMLDASINIAVASIAENNNLGDKRYLAMQSAVSAVRGGMSDTGVLCGALEGMLGVLLPNLLKESEPQVIEKDPSVGASNVDNSKEVKHKPPESAKRMAAQKEQKLKEKQASEGQKKPEPKKKTKTKLEIERKEAIAKAAEHAANDSKPSPVARTNVKPTETKQPVLPKQTKATPERTMPNTAPRATYSYVPAAAKKQSLWESFSEMADRQYTEYWEQPRNHKFETETIDKFIFKPIRQAKEVIINSIDHNFREFEHIPVMRSMYLWQAATARIGLSLIPDTPIDFTLSVGLSFAGRPVYYLGKQTFNYGQKLYYVGTMGTARGQATYSLARALNTTPVVRDYATVSLASSQAYKPTMLFSDGLGYAQGNSVSATSIQNIELVANKQFLVRGLSKNEARAFITQNQELLSNELQFRGVMKAIKNIGRTNGEIDILKISSTDNIRVYSRRPGYDGLQSMIAEIRTDGTTRAVVQTAADSLGNLVQQKPGQLKNNIFDVKKFSME